MIAVLMAVVVMLIIPADVDEEDSCKKREIGVERQRIGIKERRAKGPERISCQLSPERLYT